MARLRSARLAKDADDAGTKQSPAAELSVKTDMTGSSVAEQTGTREPSVDELALQTAQKMKERLLRAVTCEVDSGSSYLKREPDILTLESKKSSGHPKAGRYEANQQCSHVDSIKHVTMVIVSKHLNALSVVVMVDPRKDTNA